MNTKESRKEVSTDVCMSILFASLNFLDYVTTKKILKEGGVELNPIANFLIKKKCFGLFKLLITIPVMTTILIEPKPKNFSKFVLSSYGLAVTNNLKEIMLKGNKK